jgi:hypothetical protein
MSTFIYGQDAVNDAVRTNPAAAAFLGRGMYCADEKTQANARVTANATTLDAVSPGNGLYLARQLEYVYQELLRKKRPANNALELFPIDSRVPAGATTHTIRRLDHKAEWRYFRGSDTEDVPNAAVEQIEQSFPILPMISGFQSDIFSQLNNQFSNAQSGGLSVQLEAEMRSGVLEAYDRFMNERAWRNDDLPDISRYPYMPKTVSAVNLGIGTAADTVLAELNRLISLPWVTSKNVFGDRVTVAMDDRLYEIISTRKLPNRDQTILQALYADNMRLEEIIPIYEMRTLGPSGGPAIMGYRSGDLASVAHVAPVGPTALPVEVRGFKMIFPFYAMHGGIVMREPLHNFLAGVSF